MAGMSNTYYTEFRPDGWPLCPQCGEDELYSELMLDYLGEGERPIVQDCIAGEMACYYCNWSSRRERLNQVEWPEEI